MKYLQPKTLPELAEALGQMTEDSHLLAGCTDFLAKRNGVSWEAEVLVSLSAMEDLRRIEEIKTECARKIFNELSLTQVRYDVVTDYHDLLDKINNLKE